MIRGARPIALLAILLGATRAHADEPGRVVVLADAENAVHRAIGDELRIQVHRAHRDVGFEVVTTDSVSTRQDAGARLRARPPTVVVLLGASMVDDVLPLVPAGTARLYADVSEHDRRVPELRQKGVVGVVDRCPVEAMVRLARRLMPTASTVTWLGPENTQRGALGAALATATRAQGVQLAMSNGREKALDGPALVFTLPPTLFDRSQDGPARLHQGSTDDVTWRPSPSGALVVTCSGTAFERGATAAFVSESEEVAEELGEQVNAVLDGKAPGDESVEAAAVMLHAGAACVAGATVDTVMLANAVVRGAKQTCAPPPRSRAGWWALSGAGLVTAVLAFGARWRISRGRPARG